MAEIKISELSIGDWVEIQGVVKRIDYLYGKDNVCDVPIELIRPIPLTPEILEKNGWSKKNNDGWHLFHYKDIRINIWSDKDRWDIEVSSEDKRVTYADITGRGTLHTHQLQHALRLTGVEKGIEL